MCYIESAIPDYYTGFYQAQNLRLPNVMICDRCQIFNSLVFLLDTMTKIDMVLSDLTQETTKYAMFVTSSQPQSFEENQLLGYGCALCVQGWNKAEGLW